MCTLGFGPEMIDFRTVLAAAFLLRLTLVLSLAAEMWARGRRASNAKALLPLLESPKVADDAMTPDVNCSLFQISGHLTSSTASMISHGSAFRTDQCREAIADVARTFGVDRATVYRLKGCSKVGQLSSQHRHGRHP
jgi:hypothetical protein